MLNLLYCELLKLKNSKIFLLCMLGAFAVPFMMFIEAVQSHAEHPERSITLSLIYDDSLLYVMLIMNIMIGIALISYIFSREYMDQTLKTVLPIPISRCKLLTGKFILSLLFTIILNLISWTGTLLLSLLFHQIWGLDNLQAGPAFDGLLCYMEGAVLMFLTSTPFAYLAIRTKGFVAPMITSAVMVMGSAALCNQKWGSLYPWTSGYLLLSGKYAKNGYPIALSIGLILFVSLAGLILTYQYFKKENL